MNALRYVAPIGTEGQHGWWCKRCSADVRVELGFPKCNCEDSPSPWVPYDGPVDGHPECYPTVKGLFQLLYEWWFPVNPGAK